MQRITNCILIDGNKALVLQKPSKGWWVAPGGKMELGETVKESSIREYKEETGLSVCDPEIAGIFTIVIKDDETIVDEWMMFTFRATKYEGVLFDESPEGELAWKDVQDIKGLPMAEGDKYIFDHVIKGEDTVLYGTFEYTKDWKLIGYRL